MSFLSDLTSASNQRRQVAELMPLLGFGVMIPSDETHRPIRAAWYGGNWQGRHAVATVMRRQFRIGPGADMSSRRDNVVCLQLTIEPSLRRSIGFGVSKPLGKSSPTTVAEAFPPDHAAYGFHPQVKEAFVALVQPKHRRRPGPQLRITDRQTLNDYLPTTIHPNALSLVMREVPIEADIAQEARFALDNMSWLATILEQTEMPG